jgi:N-acetylglutamate synthase-like GNAT family acetyltransferase
VEIQKNYQIRFAEDADQIAIRSLIRRVRINPLNLIWRNFLVAIDEQGQIIGCGQIKTHRDGTNELASIAVEDEWRKSGVGSAIIRTLIKEADIPLWLVCRSEMAPFYERFGFEDVGDATDLPIAYRRMRSMARLFSRILPNMGKFAIMMLDTASKV